MNPYLKNLNKIEFVLTYDCTGRCRHCSEGEHRECSEEMDSRIAADSVRKIVSKYDIKTVMVFGGEPLLCLNSVMNIMNTAKELHIPRRQVITNGYFSKDNIKIRHTSDMLLSCGVNDLLISVDAFHQEFIPLDIVKMFAYELKIRDVPVRLSPAWLVSPDHPNPYNLRTREILDSFKDMDIPIGEGNIVFPEGNALKYLSEYFTDSRPENPYTEDPRDVRCLSFSPNGDVLDGNVYEKDIMEVLENYNP